MHLEFEYSDLSKGTKGKGWCEKQESANSKKQQKAKMASRSKDSCRKVVLVEVRQCVGIAPTNDADDID